MLSFLRESAFRLPPIEQKVNLRVGMKSAEFWRMIGCAAPTGAKKRMGLWRMTNLFRLSVRLARP